MHVPECHQDGADPQCHGDQREYTADDCSRSISCFDFGDAREPLAQEAIFGRHKRVYERDDRTHGVRPDVCHNHLARRVETVAFSRFDCTSKLGQFCVDQIFEDRQLALLFWIVLGEPLNFGEKPGG